MKEKELWRKKRDEAYKNSILPYCFEYKIKRYFIGEMCPICSYPMISPIHPPTIQHNIPISLGGKHEIENISIICKKCNISLRGTITGELNNLNVKKLWEIICEEMKNN